MQKKKRTTLHLFLGNARRDCRQKLVFIIIFVWTKIHLLIINGTVFKEDKVCKNNYGLANKFFSQNDSAVKAKRLQLFQIESDWFVFKTDRTYTLAHIFMEEKPLR